MPNGQNRSNNEYVIVVLASNPACWIYAVEVPLKYRFYVSHIIGFERNFMDYVLDYWVMFVENCKKPNKNMFRTMTTYN